MNQAPGLGRKILVIEDEFALQEVMRDALESDGYCVTCADNGREGLARLKDESSPHLILLDLMMPIMGGRDFLKEVIEHKVFSHIPVVVVSTTVDGRELPGAIVVVRKPPDLDRLLALVACHSIPPLEVGC